MVFSKKIQYFFSFFVVFFALLPQTGCNPVAVRKYKRVKDLSIAKVLLKKELLIGIESDIPPFMFTDMVTGKMEGYEAEVAEEVCRILGVNPVFKVIDWDEKDRLLAAGEIDCVWSNFTYTDERSALYALSKPYMKTALVIACLQDAGYANLDEVKHRRIGVQRSSSALDSIERARGLYGGFNEPVFFDNIASGLKALDDGETDAVLYDLFVINNYIRIYNKPYKIIGEPVDGNDYVIAFRKNDNALKNKIDEIIDFLAREDVLERISRKWFGINVSIFRK